MKITDKLSVNLDNILYVAIGDYLDGKEHTKYIVIEDITGKSGYELYDNTEGKGFCEKLKAKIDAYLEAKELKVMAEYDFIKKENERQNAIKKVQEMKQKYDSIYIKPEAFK